MKISEASELLDCSFCLLWGIITGVAAGKWDLVDKTFARINEIHAGIEARKVNQ
jgi:hypothetical protein